MNDIPVLFRSVVYIVFAPESLIIRWIPDSPPISIQFQLNVRFADVIISPLNGLVGLHTGATVSIENFIPVLFLALSHITSSYSIVHAS
jgi:hypothetical protein